MKRKGKRTQDDNFVSYIEGISKTNRRKHRTEKNNCKAVKSWGKFVVTLYHALHCRAIVSVLLEKVQITFLQEKLVILYSNKQK